MSLIKTFPLSFYLRYNSLWRTFFFRVSIAIIVPFVIYMILFSFCFYYYFFQFFFVYCRGIVSDIRAKFPLLYERWSGLGHSSKAAGQNRWYAALLSPTHTHTHIHTGTYLIYRGRLCGNISLVIMASDMKWGNSFLLKWWEYR